MPSIGFACNERESSVSVNLAIQRCCDRTINQYQSPERQVTKRFNRGRMIPTSEMPPVIKLNGVTKVFVTDEVETHALERIDVEIGRGEYVAISGPSGCGKS